jgi:hypothetical protein
MMARIRKFLRGFGSNIRGDHRSRKEELKRDIAELDKKADRGELDGPRWATRYRLEEELVQVYK